MLWHPVCSAATQQEYDLSKMAAAFPAPQQDNTLHNVYGFLISQAGRAVCQQLHSDSGIMCRVALLRWSVGQSVLRWISAGIRGLIDANAEHTGEQQSIKTAHWGELSGYWFSCAGIFCPGRARMHAQINLCFCFFLLKFLVSDDILRVDDILDVDRLLSLFCGVLLTKEANAKKHFFYLF